jgi:8-oxo-dGTP pyrophosphatase MutT (NUDIX family)
MKGDRPRDAATLIIVRRDDHVPRVLLGKRHGGHAFMPNKFVFPGGRLDAADCRMVFAADLAPPILAHLMSRMRDRPSPSRARGLALAAVRETFEEVGLIAGTPGTAKRSSSPAWTEFTATGYLPSLSGLRFVARAITPPGRPRRFDSRFFLIDARAIANLDRPHHSGSGELLDVHWFPLAEALGLDLPSITRDILGRLKPVIDAGQWPDETFPVSFQFHRHRRWCIETLSSPALAGEEGDPSRSDGGGEG